MKGAHWLVIGVLLLVIMFVGVRWLYSPSSAADGQSKMSSADAAGKPPESIVCWGFFENEKGVAALTPKQFGDIIYVRPDNSVVKKGDVLLQLNDKMARLKVEEAEADVKAGTQQLAEARQLTKFYALQNEQQKASVDSVELEIKKTISDRDIQVDLRKENPALQARIKEMFGFHLGQLGEKKKAEEAKLKQLQLQDPQLKIRQAEADLDAKKARLDQAKESLTYFQIVADGPGKVLRTFVHKGEMLSPTPRMNPALEFMPEGRMIVRAEVLQEWGRFVKENQDVLIEDDTYKGTTWKGKVKSVSDWYAPTRSPVIEPFRYNDVRTLEVIIDVKDADNAKHNQRVRAKIKIN
jgi:multidrug resistance efflux pump